MVTTDFICENKGGIRRRKGIGGEKEERWRERGREGNAAWQMHYRDDL